MPLVLGKSGAVFLHPMKTGGTWVRHALEAAGVECSDRGDGDSHTDWASSLDVSPGGHRFTIVRNPFDWYASFWAFRDKVGWGGSLTPGHACQSDTFEGFVESICRECSGFLTEYFGRYVREGVVVMRTETLDQSLVAVLEWLGEPFDRRRLMATPPTNLSAALPEYRTRTLWTPTMVSLVVESERELFRKYRYPVEGIE